MPKHMACNTRGVVACLQLLDATHGGFCYLTYWLEIQQMALQHTRGKTGPEAVAMAQRLIKQLPHSVLLTRCA
jgi:hypothetical protein